MPNNDLPPGFVRLKKLLLIVCVCLCLSGLGACSGSGDAAGPAELAAWKGGMRLSSVDALEALELPCSCELHEAGDGGLSINLKKSAAPVHSLYLHLSYDPRRHGAATAELSPDLRDRALLIAIEDEAGLLRLGLAAIGEDARLPADSELVRISFDGQGAIAAQRRASAAAASAVADLAFSTENPSRLEWTFCVNGDYDQNGSVTIGDVTPIGQHFGKGSGSGDWAVARVADGDRNSLISISDLTPIGANFGSRVSSFVVRTSASAGGPFSFVPGSITAFADFPQPQAGGPRRFSHTLANGVDRNFYVVAARDGTEESASLSSAVEFIEPNAAPVVTIEGETDSVSPGERMIISASFSDSDGTVEALRWDLDGNGSFETDGEVESPQTLSDPFTTLGDVKVGARVTDNKGTHGYAVLDVRVSYGAKEEIVLRSGESYFHPRIVHAGGRPCVSVFTLTEHDAVYSDIATTEAADEWIGLWQFDSSDVTSLSMCEVDGMPALAAGFSSRPPAYCHTLDDGGINWARQDIALPSLPDDGSYIKGVSLAERGGLPAITFGITDVSLTNQTLYYVSPDDDSFASWDEFIIGSTSATGDLASLCVSGPNAYVIFGNNVTSMDFPISLAVSSDIRGSMWSEPQPIGAGVPSYLGVPSLLSDPDGIPAAATWDETAKQLVFRRGGNGTLPVIWDEAVVAGAARETEAMFSLAYINELPCIAYYDSALPGIRLLCARDMEGRQWNKPINVLTTAEEVDLQLADRAPRPMLIYTVPGAFTFVQFRHQQQGQS